MDPRAWWAWTQLDPSIDPVPNHQATSSTCLQGFREFFPTLPFGAMTLVKDIGECPWMMSA